MTRAAAPRWAITFADLALVLLAFFVLMQAHRHDGAAVAASVRAAMAGRVPPRDELVRYDPAKLFEPGEARLTAPGRAALAALAERARSGGGTVEIEAGGGRGASARFDGWELSAARVAAAGRALAAGGVAPARLRMAVPAASGDDPGASRLSVVLRAQR